MSPLSAFVLSKFKGVWVDIFLVFYRSAALLRETLLLTRGLERTLFVMAVWHDEQPLAAYAFGTVEQQGSFHRCSATGLCVDLE